jgi:XisH protein
MPARDIYHDTVKAALVKDGWVITHDPMMLSWGKADVYVDLGAEQMIAAEKAERKIAVEIKSFVGASPIEDLRNALGQYVLYHDILLRIEPDRTLYLAVQRAVYEDLFEDPIGQLLLGNNRLRLVVFDPHTEEIQRWLP